MKHKSASGQPAAWQRPVAGILFDKDGTLIDFRSTWLAAYRGAAAEVCALAGLAPAFARTLLARSGYDSGTDSFAPTSPLLWATNGAIAARWAAEPEVAGLADAAVVARRHLDDDGRYPPRPVGDLPPLFARLRGRGLRLGMATMDSGAKARALGARLGIDALLDFVTGCDDGHGEKPGPGMVQGFCAATGVSPERVLVVGDTLADVAMARAAGAMAVAVLTGATPRAVLEAHADRVLVSVMEIETLL